MPLTKLYFSCWISLLISAIFSAHGHFIVAVVWVGIAMLALAGDSFNKR